MDKDFEPGLEQKENKECSRKKSVGREEGEKKDIRKTETQRNIVWLIPDDIAKPNCRS